MNLMCVLILPGKLYSLTIIGVADGPPSGPLSKDQVAVHSHPQCNVMLATEELIQSLHSIHYNIGVAKLSYKSPSNTSSISSSEGL